MPDLGSRSRLSLLLTLFRSHICLYQHKFIYLTYQYKFICPSLFQPCIPSPELGKPSCLSSCFFPAFCSCLALLLAGHLVFVSLSYQISYHPSICFPSSKIWWISLICWCLSQSSYLFALTALKKILSLLFF